MRIAAIQQSKAYQEMANGAPWDKLSENMRKTILYNHILEQVTANLGSSLQDNTNLRLANFTAALMDVRLALGQAFLPIVNVALPYLTTFMRTIEKAFQYVSSFMRGLFGIKPDVKGIQSQTDATHQQTAAVSGLGDAQEAAGKKAKKAAKEAQGALMGFDEVNVLPDKAAGSAAGAGGGGGGAAGMEAPGGGGLPLQGGDPTPFQNIIKSASEMGAKISKALEPVIRVVKKVFGAIAAFVMKVVRDIGDWWDENGDQIIKAFKNVWKAIKPIVMWIVKFVWDSIKGLIEGVIQFFEGFIEFFAGVFTGDWGKAWEGIKDMFFGAFKAIMNFLNLSFIGGIKKIFLEIAESGVKAFLGLVTKSKASWEEMWTGVKTTATSYLDDAWKAIKGKFDAWVTSMKTYGSSMLTALTEKFATIKTWFTENVTSKIASAFSDAKTSIANKAGDVWTAVKDKFSTAYAWFRDNVVKAPYNAFITWKDGIASKAGAIWTAIKEKFSGVKDWFDRNVVQKIKDAFTRIKSGFEGGMKSGVIAILNTGIRLINWWIGKFNNILDAVDKITPGKLGNVPKIKEIRLAKGGITRGPTHALIGEAGTEVVSPLDQLMGMIGTAVTHAIAATGGGRGGANAPTGDINMTIDGRTFARIVKPYLERENQRVGANVRLNRI